MKLPYKTLLVYCIVSGMKFSEASDWMNGVLGLPIDESLYTSTKKRKFAKSWSEKLIDYIDEYKNTIEAIVNGFGRKEIFIKMISMLSNGIKFEEAAGILKENFNINYNGYAELFQYIFDVSDWDDFDWYHYITFINSLQDNPIRQNIPTAKFSSKEELLYTLGIGVSDFVQDALLAHKKQAKIYHQALDSNAVDSEEISILGTLYQSSLSVLANLTEKGLVAPQGAENAIAFARKKAEHEPITNPKFENIESGGEDGNSESK